MRTRPIAVLLCIVCLAASAQSLERFTFTGPAPVGSVAVDASIPYSDARHFGFEPSIPGGGPERNFFSVKLPEGNYTAQLTFTGIGHPAALTVKAESGRLLLDHLAIPAHGDVEQAVTVNVRTPALPKLPRNAVGREEVTLDQFDSANSRDWDDRLTFEFDGPIAALHSLQISSADVPTVFIAGDSTVTDRNDSYDVSWGQLLPVFFRPGVAVSNQAQSGETLKSFANALRLDKILSVMRPGDYLFIQFGHNDSKENWPQTYVEASTTYKAWLRVYIAEARRRGGIPVLVTPMDRADRTTGMPAHSLGGYPEAMRQVAAEEHVALVDLNAMSDVLYRAAGKNAPKLLADGTHSTAYGGYEFAQCIVDGIRQNHLALAKYLRPTPSFDPAHPDAPQALGLADIFPTKPSDGAEQPHSPGPGPL